MLIYRLHILKYIAGLPIRRHFQRNKCIFKMSIRVPYSPHKLFRFVRRLFKEKSVILASAVAVGTLLVKSRQMENNFWQNSNFRAILPYCPACLNFYTAIKAGKAAWQKRAKMRILPKI